MCNDTIFLYILINSCLLETKHKPYIWVCGYYTIENEKKKYPNRFNINKINLFVKN